MVLVLPLTSYHKMLVLKMKSIHHCIPSWSISNHNRAEIPTLSSTLRLNNCQTVQLFSLTFTPHLLLSLLLKWYCYFIYTKNFCGISFNMHLGISFDFLIRAYHFILKFAKMLRCLPVPRSTFHFQRKQLSISSPTRVSHISKYNLIFTYVFHFIICILCTCTDTGAYFMHSQAHSYFLLIYSELFTSFYIAYSLYVGVGT